MNELSYPEELHFVSRMAVNNLYQPWRAILSMINQCLKVKTSGYDRPRYPVLQMLWGIITRTNVDYAKLIWEEFVQAIQTFFADKANLGMSTKKDKKIKPHVIPYCQFTKLIICHLRRKQNIHQRFGSPFNMTEDDHHLGNLKFIPKGEEYEHDHKIEVVEGGKKKSASKVNQSKKPTTAKQPKPLVDEPDEEQAKPEPEPEPQGAGEEYDVEQAIQMSLESFQAQGQAHVGGVAIREPVAEATRPLLVVEGKGKAIATNEQVAQSLLELHTPKKTRTTDQYIFQRRISVTKEASTRPSAQPEDDASANIICDTPSPTDAETCADTDKTNSEGDTEILNIGGEQREDVANKEDLKGKTPEIDEGQARSDLGKTPEFQPPPEYVRMEEDQAGPNPGLSHVALAGPDPEPMHDDFVAIVYPQVHVSLKHPDEEHVHVENLLSSTKTLSSMKNLDAYTYEDQFFNDKPTKEDPGKINMETEVESMVTVPIHRASSLVPPLSTPVIDLTSPKLVPSTTQAPIFTATTTTETTTTLPPPPQQQSITDSSLASRVLTLEQRCANLEKKHKLQDKTTQALSSRIFTLELRDLPYKVNQTVNEAVKEAVHVALQAPIRDRFRELPEVDMKEILHQWMERANRDEFLAEKDKSRKRRYDDQYPPPPPDSYLSNKNRHDTGTSGSKQPPTPQSSTWKTSDTRETPYSSSKQKSIPHSVQPVKDMPIPNDMNISDSEDTDTAHLP
ncbi:hypothetical protein Tco_0340314 [Tanacetum coccineum]